MQKLVNANLENLTIFNHKIQWIKYVDTDMKTKGFLSNCVQPSKGKRRKSRISFIEKKKLDQKLY